MQARSLWERACWRMGQGQWQMICRTLRFRRIAARRKPAPTGLALRAGTSWRQCVDADSACTAGTCVLLCNHPDNKCVDSGMNQNTINGVSISVLSMIRGSNSS